MRVQLRKQRMFSLQVDKKIFKKNGLNQINSISATLVSKNDKGLTDFILYLAVR